MIYKRFYLRDKSAYLLYHFFPCWDVIFGYGHKVFVHVNLFDKRKLEQGLG